MKPKWKREARKARRRSVGASLQPYDLAWQQRPMTHSEKRVALRMWRQMDRDWRVYSRPNRRRRRKLAELSRALVRDILARVVLRAESGLR